MRALDRDPGQAPRSPRRSWRSRSRSCCASAATARRTTRSRSYMQETFKIAHRRAQEARPGGRQQGLGERRGPRRRVQRSDVRGRLADHAGESAGRVCDVVRRNMPATGVPIVPPVVPVSALSDSSRPHRGVAAARRHGRRDRDQRAPDHRRRGQRARLIPARDSLAERVRAILAIRRQAADRARCGRRALPRRAPGRRDRPQRRQEGRPHGPSSGEVATADPGSEAGVRPITDPASSTGSAEAGSAQAGSAQAGSAEAGSAGSAVTAPAPVPQRRRRPGMAAAATITPPTMWCTTHPRRRNHRRRWSTSRPYSTKACRRSSKATRTARSRCCSVRRPRSRATHRPGACSVRSTQRIGERGRREDRVPALSRARAERARRQTIRDRLEHL